mgnify:CR=1 FL=1
MSLMVTENKKERKERKLKKERKERKENKKRKGKRERKRKEGEDRNAHIYTYTERKECKQTTIESHQCIRRQKEQKNTK